MSMISSTVLLIVGVAAPSGTIVVGRSVVAVGIAGILTAISPCVFLVSRQGTNIRRLNSLCVVSVSIAGIVVVCLVIVGTTIPVAIARTTLAIGIFVVVVVIMISGITILLRRRICVGRVVVSLFVGLRGISSFGLTRHILVDNLSNSRCGPFFICILKVGMPLLWHCLEQNLL